MADPRMDRLEAQISSLQSVLEKLKKHSSNQAKTLADNSKNMEEINNVLYQSVKNVGENSTSKNKDKIVHNSSTAPKLTKLDFPRYNGADDPMS